MWDRLQRRTMKIRKPNCWTDFQGNSKLLMCSWRPMYKISRSWLTRVAKCWKKARRMSERYVQNTSKTMRQVLKKIGSGRMCWRTSTMSGQSFLLNLTQWARLDCTHLRRGFKKRRSFGSKNTTSSGTWWRNCYIVWSKTACRTSHNCQVCCPMRVVIRGWWKETTNSVLL